MRKPRIQKSFMFNSKLIKDKTDIAYRDNSDRFSYLVYFFFDYESIRLTI